jgi:hypothetical protein
MVANNFNSDRISCFALFRSIPNSNFAVAFNASVQSLSWAAFPHLRWWGGQGRYTIGYRIKEEMITGMASFGKTLPVFFTTCPVTSYSLYLPFVLGPVARHTADAMLLSVTSSLLLKQMGRFSPKFNPGVKGMSV